MIPRGEADYLVVLAASEVEVTRPLLRGGGLLLAPEFVPEAELANKRSLNVALLGALSAWLDIPEGTFLQAVEAALPERLHAVNQQAFRLGRDRGARAVAAAAGR
jgi:indolepyruvate ferredoxin oxidoreductase beta subunit